jgi:hypothetical protein
VIFPEGFPNHLKSIAFKFKFQKIESVPRGSFGVYIFIHRKSYLYVGKSAGEEGVKERLLNHYNGTHNEILKKYIQALNGTIRVAYITCDEEDVDDLERSLIRHFQPNANKIRYIDYEPIQKMLEI